VWCTRLFWGRIFPFQPHKKLEKKYFFKLKILQNFCDSPKKPKTNVIIWWTHRRNDAVKRHKGEKQCLGGYLIQHQTPIGHLAWVYMHIPK
jgi:hypothetical protein